MPNTHAEDILTLIEECDRLIELAPQHGGNVEMLKAARIQLFLYKAAEAARLHREYLDANRPDPRD